MNTADMIRQVFLILLGNSICLILLDRKYSVRKTLIIYSIVTAAEIALGISFYILFGRGIFLSLFPAIVNIPTLAVLFYLSKRKGCVLVFTMLTVVTISVIIVLPGGYLAQMAGWPFWIEMLTKTLAGITAIIFLYRYMRPPYLRMQSMFKKGWGYLCLIPGLYYLLILPNAINFSPASDTSRKAVISCVLALFIVIITYGVIFMLIEKTIREVEMRDEQELLKLQIQAIERHTDMLKSNEEKLQIYQHDLRHYIANVKTLIESGHTEEALHVLGSLDETLFRLM